MSFQLRIGSRESALAMVQAEHVKNTILTKYPEASIQILGIKTKGDQILDSALSKIGDKGLFTKELEQELLAGNIDLAVHGMKDLPTQLPEGLQIIASTLREDPRDVICFAPHIHSWEQVQTIASSSLRRIAQLKAEYPYINCVDMRGNLQTRFKKLDDPSNKIDAIVLAYAGVRRLGLEERISIKLDPAVFLPAVGQGSLGIEINSNASDELKNFLYQTLNDPNTEKQILAERAFLRRLEGGCQVPIGAYTQILDDGRIQLHGLVSSLDAKQIIRSTLIGSDPEVLGIELAELCLQKGAREILDNIWTNCRGK